MRQASETGTDGFQPLGQPDCLAAIFPISRARSSASACTLHYCQSCMLSRSISPPWSACQASWCLNHMTDGRITQLAHMTRNASRRLLSSFGKISPASPTPSINWRQEHELITYHPGNPPSGGRNASRLIARGAGVGICRKLQTRAATTNASPARAQKGSAVPQSPLNV